jgi:hypothetical protein
MFTQLVQIFEQDERLCRTIPKTYQLDEEKVKTWNSLNDFSYNETMNVIHVSFFEWQQAFATCIEYILTALNHRDFIMSTGSSLEIEQSASELWTFYIAKKVLQLHNVIFDDLDKSWTKISLSKKKKVDILFIDDFMLSGYHMSNRICSSKSLLKHLQPDTRIMVLSAVVPKDCEWQEPFRDLEMEHGVKLMDRIDIFAGLNLDVPRTYRILFDHKSLEELYDDLHAGYLGAKGYIGSLIKGVDPLITCQQPPALYHLEFGSGELPKVYTPLKPSNIPGFYVSINHDIFT